MKARSPITITISLGICTVFGAYCLTKPQTANAEPAPMFKPILRDIQNKLQLPKGWVIRLHKI
ncbi:MAG TPA: hypothetical protein DCS91_13805 [Microcoleaceae bacterium UBA11344]|nr:hypothetical protein [Microcoleaceae cyanobacterium UBA11344]